MRRLLLVHFLGSRVAGFLAFVFHVVDGSAGAFTDGVAGVLGLLLVGLSRGTADQFLDEQHARSFANVEQRRALTLTLSPTALAAFLMVSIG